MPILELIISLWPAAVFFVVLWSAKEFIPAFAKVGKKVFKKRAKKK